MEGLWGWQVFLSSWEASGSFWVGAVRHRLNTGQPLRRQRPADHRTVPGRAPERWV